MCVVGCRDQRWGGRRGKRTKSESRLRPGRPSRKVADKADLASDGRKRLMPSDADLLRADLTGALDQQVAGTHHVTWSLRPTGQ